MTARGRQDKITSTPPVIHSRIIQRGLKVGRTPEGVLATRLMSPESTQEQGTGTWGINDMKRKINAESHLIAARKQEKANNQA